jgi:pyrroline-5-carboxylate reductase
MSTSASPALQSSIADYGFLGVGEIAEAMVIGLCERNSNPPRILLSPRNEQRATALALRYGIGLCGARQPVARRRL